MRNRSRTARAWRGDEASARLIMLTLCTAAAAVFLVGAAIAMHVLAPSILAGTASMHDASAIAFAAFVGVAFLAIAAGLALGL